MNKNQSGRTLLETLAVLALIGILSVSGLRLYAKAMNTVRVNYIMQQVFIKANELVKNPVAKRRKTVDISMSSTDGKLAYGYSFSSGQFLDSDKKIQIGLEGYFSAGLCKMLWEKMNSKEFKDMLVIKNKNDQELSKNNCLGEDVSLTFVVNSNFVPKKKTVAVEDSDYQEALKSYINNEHVPVSKGSSDACNKEGALQCNPLICNQGEGWYEFDDDPGQCEQCPAGYFCEE